MNKQKFIGWLAQRLLSKQPKFYLLLQTYSLYLIGLVCVVFLGVHAFNVPAATVATITSCCKYATIVLLSIMGTAQTGTVKSDLISDDAKAEIMNEAKAIEAAK